MMLDSRLTFFGYMGMAALYLAPCVFGILYDHRAIKLVKQGIRAMNEDAKALKVNYNIDSNVPKDFRDYLDNYRNKT